MDEDPENYDKIRVERREKERKFQFYAINLDAELSCIGGPPFAFLKFAGG